MEVQSFEAILEGPYQPSATWHTVTTHTYEQVSCRSNWREVCCTLDVATTTLVNLFVDTLASICQHNNISLDDQGLTVLVVSWAQKPPMFV